MNGLVGKVIKYGVILLLVNAIASGGLAVTYELTKEEIARQRFLQQVRAVQQVIEEASSPDYVVKREDLAEEAASRFKDVGNIFEVNIDGKTVGYAVQVTPKGYGGPISMIVGLTPEGKVTGVRVVEHKETPGLGTNVTESEEFLTQYEGKDPSSPVEIGTDVDAVSGATISSKGVTAGVRLALDVYEQVLKGEGR